MKASRRSLVFAILPLACRAQGLEYIKAHYTKYEHLVLHRSEAALYY